MSSQTNSFSDFQKNLRVPFGGTSHGFINRKSTSYRGVSEVITNNTKYERCFNSPWDYKVTMVTGRKRFVSNVVEGRLYINRVN
jgi:hypothetical protein